MTFGAKHCQFSSVASLSHWASTLFVCSTYTVMQRIVWVCQWQLIFAVYAIVEVWVPRFFVWQHMLPWWSALFRGDWLYILGLTLDFVHHSVFFISSSVSLELLGHITHDGLPMLCGWRRLANAIKNSAMSLACGKKDLTLCAKVRLLLFAPVKKWWGFPQNNTSLITYHQCKNMDNNFADHLED